jgi:hypothetical protein
LVVFLFWGSRMKYKSVEIISKNQNTKNKQMFLNYSVNK